MADSNEITALIKQAQQGNSQSFGSLVLNYEKFIYNTAFRMLSNAEDARDIAQEALIKAYKNIDKFDFNSSFSTWLYRITVNTCIDELRKRKGKETYSTDSQDEETGLSIQVADTVGSAEETVLEKETVLEVRRAIDMLSEEHKAVIILRDIQDLSYEEVAESLGVNIGTVKSRLARGRKKLKDIITAQWEQKEKAPRQNIKKGGERL